MKWYTGGIAEAVNASKSKGAIFVVYIEGADDNSKRITESIDNGVLGQELESESFVAIKIEAGSVSHQQFSEIFKEPSVPSVYFIGRTGAPLDIITGSDSLDNVKERIRDILVKEGIAVNKTDADISQNLIQNEKTTTENSNNVVCENGVCSIRRDPAPSTSEISLNTTTDNGNKASTSQEHAVQELTHDEKVEKAKQLLEKKRLEKEKEERELERQKELERRKVGQGVHKLKQWQEEQEMKQLKEEREKEKREKQLARERVLLQIAQDKAERQSKSLPAQPTPKTTVTQSSPPKANSSISKLQFKLPDGSTTMQEFSITDSLQTVVSFVKSNLKVTSTDFRLSTVFPRREFTENDYSQTLSDLQLFPNAVILVLPINKGTVATNPGGTITLLFWNLFAPLINIFDYLKNLVFGTNTTAGANKRPSERNPTEGQEQPKRVMRDSTVVRRQGNIHRLGDRRDSDEDGNTWNGNSTQQM